MVMNSTRSKKMLTSMLSIILVCVAIFAFTPIRVNAETDGVWEYDIDYYNKAIKITGYSGNEQNLIIPSSLDGYQVTIIGNRAFSGCTSLTSVTIPEGVTRIDFAAFSRCSSLTNITIPEGVTTIEDSAFSECTSLTNITIPEGVTTIGNSAFYKCTSLTNITIPNSVTIIHNRAFKGCSSLTMYVDYQSYAHRYAKENSFDYEIIGLPEGIIDVLIVALGVYIFVPVLVQFKLYSSKDKKKTY